MTANLSTHYLGFTLRNPIVASAGPLTGDLDALQRLEESGIAAAVLPSLFEEQITRPRAEHRVYYEYSTGCYTATISGPDDIKQYNYGPRDYLHLVEAAKQFASIPIIGSLNGCSRGGWIRYAREIQDAGADALELNIYIVPTSPFQTAKEIEDQYLDLVRAVRGAITIPLAVKIGAQFSSLPNFVAELTKAGADGVVLFNRFLEPDVDLHSLQFVSQLVLSNPHEILLPLRWIGILRDQTSVSLAASSGVHTARDVVKLLLAGADVVMMTSTLLKRGTDCVIDLIRELQHWLEVNSFGSVEQAKGSLSYGCCAETGEIERAHYMKAIASYSAVH
jgi:dihydroorotate dehydrogenase (fumarate)